MPCLPTELSSGSLISFSDLSAAALVATEPLSIAAESSLAGLSPAVWIHAPMRSCRSAPVLRCGLFCPVDRPLPFAPCQRMPPAQLWIFASPAALCAGTISSYERRCYRTAFRLRERRHIRRRNVKKVGQDLDVVKMFLCVLDLTHLLGNEAPWECSQGVFLNSFRSRLQ